MKKILPFALLVLFSFSSFSQWCSNTIKLGELDGQTKFTNIPVLEIDPDGNVWFSPEWSTFGGQGVWKITDTDTVKFLHESIMGPGAQLWPAASAIAFDNNDSVWVGTQSGLAHFDGISQTDWTIYKTDNSDIPGNNITAIEIDESNVVWIGTANGKLATFSNGTWTTVKSFDIAINDIAIDHEGGVWVAKNGTPGLTRHFGDGWTDYNDFSNIKFITVDQFHRLLVSSSDSLVILFNQEISNVIKGRNDWNLELDDIAVGPNAQIWVSSNQGLLLKLGNRFQRFNRFNSPVPDGMRPVPLEFDDEGNLWFSFQYTSNNNPFPGIGYLFRSAEDATPIEVTNVQATDGSYLQPVSNYPVAAFCFGDSVIMEATESAGAYAWGMDANATDRSFVAYDTDTIPMAYQAPDQCYYYDTIRVLAQHVFQDEKICVVTVSLDTHNLVVFEKTPEVGTEFYYLYREVQTDVFEYITQVPVTRLSVFVDETSDPRERSYKYKITSVDTCGNESDVLETAFHKTMHLVFDPEQGTLVWQNYEGIYVPEYIIYKGESPTEVDMVEVARVPADDVTLTWKDTDPTVGTKLYYYRVGVALDSWCVPTGNAGKKAGAGPYSHAMSNVENNRLQVESVGRIGAIQVKAWPNPFSDYTHILFDNPGNHPYELVVFDISGKIVQKLSSITGNQIKLDRNNLPSGFYTFDLRGEKRYVGKFIIK